MGTAPNTRGSTIGKIRRALDEIEGTDKGEGEGKEASPLRSRRRWPSIGFSGPINVMVTGSPSEVGEAVAKLLLAQRADNRT